MAINKERYLPLRQGKVGSIHLSCPEEAENDGYPGVSSPPGDVASSGLQSVSIAEA